MPCKNFSDFAYLRWDACRASGWPARYRFPQASPLSPTSETVVQAPTGQRRPIDFFLIFNIRGAVRMEGWHGFHPPCLTFGAFGLRPVDHRLIWVQNQPCTRVGELDAVTAWLPYVEEEGLVNRVLIRP